MRGSRSFSGLLLTLNLNPGCLGGMLLWRWFGLLADNRFKVAPRYWPRVVMITLCSLIHTLIAGCEALWFGRRIREISLQPPLFVLGLPRSGTTHLQRLLAADSRFGFLTWFQARFPHCFLITESWAKGLAGIFVEKRRFQDNVRMAVDVSAEDDDVLAATACCSQNLVRAFGTRKDYNRFRRAEGFTLAERARWVRAHQMMMRRLAVRYEGRPLVLKSPAHTGRLQLVLESAPEARFVFIHREPEAVIRSALHMSKALDNYISLQECRAIEDLEMVELLAQTMNAYLDHRHRVPKGCLVEIAYADLAADPLTTLRRVYAELGLPDFEEATGEVEAYLESIQGYQRNRHEPPPAELMALIYEKCPRWFSEWGYAVPTSVTA